MWLDFIASQVISYQTGCSRLPSDPMYSSPDCGVTILPYSAILRPVLLIMRSKDLRDTIYMFLLTIMQSWKVTRVAYEGFGDTNCNGNN